MDNFIFGSSFSLMILQTDAKRVDVKGQMATLLNQRLKLLLYLIKSPIYERHVRGVVKALAKDTQGSRIPFLETLTSMLSTYLDHYQQYFYFMWSQ